MAWHFKTLNQCIWDKNWETQDQDTILLTSTCHLYIFSMHLRMLHNHCRGRGCTFIFFVIYVYLNCSYEYIQSHNFQRKSFSECISCNACGIFIWESDLMLVKFPHVQLRWCDINIRLNCNHTLHIFSFPTN